MRTLTKLIVLAAAVIAIIGFLLLRAVARSEPTRQPIEFDHWQHVTKGGDEAPQLECTFCHEHVDKSAHATIPNITTCMGCHESIKTESPEIQKLAAFAERKEQPPWKRVYWLAPEANAYYTHKPHIKAGIECTTCHGKIGEMHRVRREVNQTMGWCIECHQTRSVSVDCYVCHR